MVKSIADYISINTIEDIRKRFQNSFGLDFEVYDVQGNRIDEFCSGGSDNQFCNLVNYSNIGKGRCKQDRIRALNIAIETGEPYIFVCHAGIVLVCVPVMEGELPIGGLFFGKCLWEKPDEILEKDILTKLEGVVSSKKKIAESLNKLKVVNGRKIHEAAQYLYMLLYEISGLDPRIVHWQREKSYQQSQIAELIVEQKKKPSKTAYPYEYEQLLMAKVKIGDRIGVRDTLNIMLASLMLSSPGDIDVLKARMLELTTLLSRAAAEGGVDINILLEQNLKNINTLIKINTQQDLCTWIGRAVDRFIELVYEKQDSQKITQIKPAIDFMQSFYDKQIALSDVATAAHLSVSRLSHVFKEQMGITVVDYLTQVRLEKAKELLISTDKNCTEVCYDVGYNNQSYFTRTFKEIVGMTPRQFRKSNKR